MTRVLVDLFAEDQAHESVARALLARIGSELGFETELRVRISEGGAGSALTELEGFQRARLRGVITDGMPDLLAVLIDANSYGWQARKRAVLDAIDNTVFARACVGCPDPYVEKWLVADASSFRAVAGGPLLDPSKGRTRANYKNQLADSLRAAGNPLTQGGIEFAPDLIAAMDLQAASRTEASFADFLSELRGTFKQLQID